MSWAALAIAGPLIAGLVVMILKRWQAAWALVGVAVGFIGALMAFTGFTDTRTLQLPYGIPDLPFTLELSQFSSLISLVVAGVALAVTVYAVGYMQKEKAKTRFYSAFLGFITAMQLFVLAGDWILLLTSWELMALASYLLIAHERSKTAVTAGTRAFLTTRTADIGIYGGVILLISTSGTSSIGNTFAVPDFIAMAAGIGFIVSAIAKAAQVPFDGWLRDAMAGPTPVSALLHSATMVAAGVLLLIRIEPLLTPALLLTIGIIGGITIILTGATAIAQTDVKRMLAASTSSQIGFMLLALGAGSVGAAVAHFIAHATMKATLFMGAGIFQHGAGSTQYEKTAGFARKFRWTYWLFALAGLALAGIPPLAGFWSKEAVIASTFASSYASVFVPFALVGTALTGWYIAKALRLLWVGDAASKEVAGKGWMIAGMAGLGVTILILSMVIEPLIRLIGLDLPRETTSLIAGLVAVGIGVVLGTFFDQRRLEPLLRSTSNGWYVSKSLDSAVTIGTNALTRTVKVLDQAIEWSVYAIARVVSRFLAGTVSMLDYAGTAIVYGAGSATVFSAHISQTLLERQFERTMTATGSLVYSFGNQFKKLQSGLVHQEMAWSLGFVLVIVSVAIIIIS